MEKKYARINVDRIEIEKGVKFQPKCIGKSNKWYLLFSRMDVLDSFALKFSSEQYENIRQSMARATQRFKKVHEPEWNFTSRTNFAKGEIRIWRIK